MGARIPHLAVRVDDGRRFAVWSRPMRVASVLSRLSAAALGAAALSSAPSAHADEAQSAEPQDPTLRPVKRERRSGVVLGTAVGVGFAGASGYPNNARLIGDPDYFSQSPPLVGVSHSYFLMGALSDVLNFGPLVNIATFENERWRSTGFALGFRAEVFPLVRLAPKLADTSVYGQLGFGYSDLRAKGPYPTADGGQSFLGLGVHHEFRLTKLLGGHASAGPFVEYDAVRATSAERHWLSVGLRVVWYGGHVAADAGS
jgi:hypothetical protein